MKKLLEQILKFGVVGVVCFGIDYVVGLAALNILLWLMGEEGFTAASVVASALGFVVSVIVNYILSFRFVFVRKENLDKRKEFVIFVILSLIGMGINSLIIWVFAEPVYRNVAWMQRMDYNLIYTGAKVVATAVVMVYNFVTRKLFLESKEKK